MRQLLTDGQGNPISFTARRRHRRVRHPHLPALFYLVQNRSWNDAIRRANSQPHEVEIQEDISGNTPLHIACRLDPPAQLVRAFLPASRVTNAEGSTALHLAATHRCSVDVLRVLLETSNDGDDCNESPTACLTRMGRAPIHYACMSFRGLGAEAFRVLLEATIRYGHLKNRNDQHECDFFEEETEQKSVVCDEKGDGQKVNVMTLRDCTGQTPLGLLFRRYRERVRCVIKRIERLQTEHNGSPSTASIEAAMTVQAHLGELWEKARLIVARLAEERLQREGSTFDMTNNNVPSPGEEAVAREAAAWAAEQYRTSLREESDEQHVSATVGSCRFLIVHASVGLTGYGCPPEMIRLAISIHPSQVHEMNEDGNLPLHIAAAASSYVSCSTQHEQAAVHVGGAPLVHASDDDSLLSDMSFLSTATYGPSMNAFDKVIRILLQRYPAAARIPHGRTGQLPLMIAIKARRRTWDDGIRSLLKSYPAALESRRMPIGLFPLILAKIGNECDDKLVMEGSHVRSRKREKRGNFSSLTTLYELVKAKPDLAMKEKQCE